MSDDHISGLVGEIRGEIKAEGKHTRDSISKLFDLSRNNEVRITVLESGGCPMGEKLEEKIENHTHDGQTITKKREPLSPKQIGALIGGLIAAAGGAAGAIAAFVKAMSK